MLALVGAITAGVLIALLSPWAMNWGLWLPLLISAMLLLLLQYRYQGRYLLSSLCCVLMLSFGWTQYRVQADLAALLPSALDGEEFLLEGQVTGLVTPFSSYGRDAVKFDFKLAPEQAVQGRLRLSWYAVEQLPRAGETWRFKLRLRRPQGFANPKGFDYAAWLMRQNIAATGYVRSEAQYLAPAQGEWLARLRGHVRAQLIERLADSPQLGVVAALTIGDRSLMSSAQWSVLRRSGTAHLLAISGLHVGLVVALVFFFVKQLWRSSYRLSSRIPAQQAAWLTALLFGLLYAGLAGLALPTQRAGLMLACAVLFLLLRRKLLASDVLLMVFACLVLAQPWALLEAGFWLSFTAVAGIAYLLSGRFSLRSALPKSASDSKHDQPKHDQLSKPVATIDVLRQRLHGWFVIQFGLWLLLAPLLALFFNRISLIAPLANLLLVPLFSVSLIPLLLFGLLAALVWPTLAAAIFQLADYLLNLLWPLLEYLAGFPWAQWVVPEQHWLVYLLAVFAAIYLLAPRGLPFKIIAVLGYSLLLLPQAKPLAEGEFAMTALDVGQGLAVVLRTREHVLVFDAGASFSSGRDTGELVVAPYLYQLGYQNIDKLMISHSDNDHAGGAASLLRDFTVAQGMGWPASDAVPWRACQAGQSWRWNGVQFRLLHPQQMTAHDENDESCVLEVQAQHYRVLIGADIEAGSERQLLQQQRLRPVDVLIAPHHGSRSSSSKDFVDTVQAKAVIFPAGRANRWGFPKPDIVARYAERGSRIYITGRDGAISLKPESGGYALETVAQTRQANYRWWQRVLHAATDPAADVNP